MHSVIVLKTNKFDFKNVEIKRLILDTTTIYLQDISKYIIKELKDRLTIYKHFIEYAVYVYVYLRRGLRK